MKFAPLALAVFASTALVSVTSADVNGGVRGSIDQTQTHRSLPAAGDGAETDHWVTNRRTQKETIKKNPENGGGSQTDYGEHHPENGGGSPSGSVELARCTNCRGGCWMKHPLPSGDKCQKINFFGGEKSLSLNDCEILTSPDVGLADGWCYKTGH